MSDDESKKFARIAWAAYRLRKQKWEQDCRNLARSNRVRADNGLEPIEAPEPPEPPDCPEP